MSLRYPIGALVVGALLVPSLLKPLLPVQAGPPGPETPRLITQGNLGGSPQEPAEVLQWRQHIETLVRQGRHAEAIPLQLQELAWVERVLGPDHPTTATSLNNLGFLYGHQGAYDKAEPFHLRALAIREKALGADHPITATSLNNLGFLYGHQGAYAKAEPL
jgi:tetratricopeptide (TPR) repeat protein